MILQKFEMEPILLSREVQEDLGDLQPVAKEILTKNNTALSLLRQVCT